MVNTASRWVLSLQRAGRIIRQGNQNPNVQIYRYVTKGTFDAYSYQTLENKQKFIAQIMTSKAPARKCEDVDQQALTYSEIKALCTGDERIKEKLMLENEVKELRVLSAEHNNTVYEMQDKINVFPQREANLIKAIDNLKTDREHLRKLPIDPQTGMPVFKITIEGIEYTDRKEAAKAFESAFLAIRQYDTTIYNLRIDSVRTQISPISVMAKLQWKTFEWKNRFTQFLLKLLIVISKLVLLYQPA